MSSLTYILQQKLAWTMTINFIHNLRLSLFKFLCLNFCSFKTERFYPQMHASVGTEISADACICREDFIHICRLSISNIRHASAENTLSEDKCIQREDFICIYTSWDSFDRYELWNSPWLHWECRLQYLIKLRRKMLQCKCPAG